MVDLLTGRVRLAVEHLDRESETRLPEDYT